MVNTSTPVKGMYSMYMIVYVCSSYYLHVYVLVAASNGDDLARPKSKTSHTTGAGKKALPVNWGEHERAPHRRAQQVKICMYVPMYVPTYSLHKLSLCNGRPCTITNYVPCAKIITCVQVDAALSMKS